MSINCAIAKISRSFSLLKLSNLGLFAQDSAEVPDCTLASKDSSEPETFAKEVSQFYSSDYWVLTGQDFFLGRCLCCFTLQNETSTSCSGENNSINPSPSSNGDAKEPTESQDNDDSDDDSSDDPDGEDVDALAKQLNKQRKRAIAAAHGRRRPISSRNAYKYKGKGTMNSKIERQACKWWLLYESFIAGILEISRAYVLYGCKNWWLLYGTSIMCVLHSFGRKSDASSIISLSNS